MLPLVVPALLICKKRKHPVAGDLARWHDFVLAGQSVIVWSMADHRELARPEAERFGQVNGIAFSHDGRLLAAAGNEGLVKLWNARDWRRWRLITGPSHGRSFGRLRAR